jgi:hypothetical protein
LIPFIWLSKLPTIQIDYYLPHETTDRKCPEGDRAA